VFFRVVQQIEPSIAFLKPAFVAKILWNVCFSSASI
jgi:hypothetical protein